MVKYLHMFYLIEKEPGILFGVNYKLRVYNSIDYATSTEAYRNPVFTQRFNTEGMANKAATTYIRERFDDYNNTLKQEQMEIYTMKQEEEYRRYQEGRAPETVITEKPVAPVPVIATKKPSSDSGEVYFTFKNQNDIDAKNR